MVNFVAIKNVTIYKTPSPPTSSVGISTSSIEISTSEG